MATREDIKITAPQAFNAQYHGGKVHMIRHRPTRDGWIVLCHRPTHDYEPYVTWAMDLSGNTYLGHYFRTRDDAMADYKTR